MLRINNLSLDLNSSVEKLRLLAANRLKVKPQDLHDFKLTKKSVDARNKNNVHFVCSVDCMAKNAFTDDKDVENIVPCEALTFKIKDSGVRPVVIGSGPAGMFAGIALAEAGLRPIIVERGSPVDIRQKEVTAFWRGGELNPESNVQFGEGGAGTFSDGKLMSGIKKDKFTAKVMQELYAAGAPEEILYLAKPHIGTDNLRQVVRNIRAKIESLGGEYRFNSRLDDLVVAGEHLKALKINHNGEIYELPADKVFLAVGNGAGYICSKSRFQWEHVSNIRKVWLIVLNMASLPNIRVWGRQIIKWQYICQMGVLFIRFVCVLAVKWWLLRRKSGVWLPME